jgi:hypothetical protein
MIERGRDRTGKREPGWMIAHRRALCRRWPARFGERGHRSRARPERRVVERGAIAIWAAIPVTREARVDEARVLRGEVGVRKSRASERGGTEIRDEDVRLPHEPHDDIAPFRRLHVDRQASLVPVLELERRIDRQLERHEPERHERADRIATGRVLDLDDVGAPIAEHRRRRGSGDEDAHLHHLDAFERSHGWSSYARAGPR